MLGRVVFGWTFHSRSSGVRVHAEGRQAFQERAAEGDNSPYYLFGVFPHHDLLAVRQGENRVWGVLNEFNEIAVDDDGLVVKSCEIDHRLSTMGQ